MHRSYGIDRRQLAAWAPVVRRTAGAIMEDMAARLGLKA